MSSFFGFHPLERDTILLTIDRDMNDLTLVQLRDALDQGVPATVRKVIVDRRDRNGSISVETAEAFGKDIGIQLVDRQIKLAFLESAEHAAIDRLHETLVQAGGCVAAFKDIADARRWLAFEMD